MILIDSIGERIKYIREKKIRVDQDLLAKFFKMSRSNLSAIENGRVNPSISMILTLSEYSNINPHWILFGEGEMFFSKEEDPTIALYEMRLNKTELLGRAYNRAQKILDILPDKIKKWRKICKISQKELAGTIKIGQSNISSIENHLIQPTTDILIKILKVLNIDFNTLFNDDENIEFISKPIKFPSIEIEDENKKILLDVTYLTSNQITLLQNLIDEFKNSNNADAINNVHSPKTMK